MAKSVSCRTMWQEWANDTTLHGIKFVFGETMVVRRVFWVVVIVIFLGYLCYTGFVQSQRYYEYKTVTRTSLTMEEKMEFPAISVCNYNLIRDDSITDSTVRKLLKDMYFEARWYTRESTLKAVKNLGDEFLNTISLRELFINGSTDLEELFMECQWIQEDFECGDHIKLRRTGSSFCYTFNDGDGTSDYSVRTTGSKSGVRFTLWVDQGNYYIGDEDSAGFKIVIHDRNMEPDLSLGLSVSPGHTFFVGLRKEEKTFLPRPVKAFGTRECVDTQSNTFKNPLEFYDHYSLHACMLECRAKFTYEKCNCSGPFDAGTYKECTPVEVFTCVHETTKIFDKTFDVDTCKCPIPCHMTTYDIKVTSAYFPNVNWLTYKFGSNYSDSDTQTVVRNNFLQVNVYFESLVTKRREQILRYTQEDLIGSFGGFLGLFIGASLITLLEILELIIISIYKCARENGNT